MEKYIREGGDFVREIKFRYYDKSRKKMINWNQIISYKKPVVINILLDDQENEKSSEWMQYTGVKDVNGKDVYEGDIVRITGVGGIDYNALIIFRDGGFCAIDGPEDDYGFRRYGLHDYKLKIELIGNIHDNPDLLEEK